MTNKKNDNRPFWRKHLSNILFVLFLAWMIIFPKNPVRIWMTEAMGFLRTQVESFELDKDEQYTFTPKDYRWQLVDLQGNPVRFSEFKEKTVLINAWATWCPPCVAELPSLEKLYRDYGQKTVFIFLAEDRPAKVETFLQQKNLQIPVYFSYTNRPPMLATRSIPTTFIIDKKGVIRVRKTGAMDWNTRKIRKLLDKLNAE